MFSLETRAKVKGKRTLSCGPFTRKAREDKSLEDDFKVPGYMCEKDRYLSAGPARCPMCGDDLQPVEWLSEAIVQESLMQGAEIEHVHADHEKFDAHGVGAFLRFRG